jgi:hypothetical protein
LSCRPQLQDHGINPDSTQLSSRNSFNSLMSYFFILP